MTREDNLKIVNDDIQRFKKNSLPATLALLGLVFNCLYFMYLYGLKVTNITVDGVSETANIGTIYIGFSVICTLFTLLLAFLAEEGIKGYNKNYCPVLIGLAVFQIIRIFYYPIYVMSHSEFSNNYLIFQSLSSTVGGLLMIIFLAISAACFIGSAVIGYKNCVKLEKFVKAIEENEIDVDAAMAELDAEDEGAPVEQAEV